MKEVLRGNMKSLSIHIINQIILHTMIIRNMLDKMGTIIETVTMILIIEIMMVIHIHQTIKINHNSINQPTNLTNLILLKGKTNGIVIFKKVQIDKNITLKCLQELRKYSSG